MHEMFGFILAAIVLMSPIPSLGAGSPTALRLTRTLPLNPRDHPGALLLRDRARVAKMLRASSTSFNGILDFKVNGTLTLGLYYTTIQLGSPPRDFKVQIDSGSDVLWVHCVSCSGCPPLISSPARCDPRASASGLLVGCEDKGCHLGAESSQADCSSTDNQCRYALKYGDVSSALGYYVQDVIHTEALTPNSAPSTATTAPIVFGCSTEELNFTASTSEVDGILGLGRNSISIISQLASEGMTPWAFSHCLRSDSSGGGMLVFGAAVDPEIVYTPLVRSRFHYNVNLRTISVNGQVVPIDPSIFALSDINQGTTIDSGTTYLFLADNAFDLVVQYVTAYLSSVASPADVLPGYQCYTLSFSLSINEFPEVRLDFDGGAFMLLGPRDYVRSQFVMGNTSSWCLNIVRSQGITVLGDVVLRDKIVVYDLDAQRIGWVGHDCSLSFNVSTVYTGHRKGSHSVRTHPPWTILGWGLLLVSTVLI